MNLAAPDQPLRLVGQTAALLQPLVEGRPDHGIFAHRHLQAELGQSLQDLDSSLDMGLQDVRRLGRLWVRGAKCQKRVPLSQVAFLHGQQLVLQLEDLHRSSVLVIDAQMLPGRVVVPLPASRLGRQQADRQITRPNLQGLLQMDAGRRKVARLERRLSRSVVINAPAMQPDPIACEPEHRQQ